MLSLSSLSTSDSVRMHSSSWCAFLLSFQNIKNIMVPYSQFPVKRTLYCSRGPCAAFHFLLASHRSLVPLFKWICSNASITEPRLVNPSNGRRPWYQARVYIKLAFSDYWMTRFIFPFTHTVIDNAASPDISVPVDNMERIWTGILQPMQRLEHTSIIQYPHRDIVSRGCHIIVPLPHRSPRRVINQAGLFKVE